MERLTEIRGTDGAAYETRNGRRVEYANTVDGQTRRMRALGCPEIVLVRAKRRAAARSAAPAPKPAPKPAIKLTVAQQDAERRRKAAAFGKTISADQHADQQRKQAADAEQQRKDKALADRMANAAGRVSR